jgi:hypothetical protein
MTARLWEMGFSGLISRGRDCRQHRPDPLPPGFLGLGDAGEAFRGAGAGGHAAVVGAPPIGEGMPLAGMTV